MAMLLGTNRGDGLVGTSGMVPQGYYKDPVKSAQTFKEVHGKRYSFPGDYALVEEDGSITLLGRGSNCINSAGEKIYPEEVEEALKLNINIDDVLVVGVDDEKFGQKVVAVASEFAAASDFAAVDTTSAAMTRFGLRIEPITFPRRDVGQMCYMLCHGCKNQV